MVQRGVMKMGIGYSSDEVLNSLSKDMVLSEHGFWTNTSAPAEVSYPDQGNELFSEIEANSFWFKHRNEVIIAGVKNFPPDGLILDIGGGNGYVSRGLIDSGFDCALVEPGEQGAKRAVERGIKDVFCTTIENLNLEENSIPAIGLFDVIEHVEDDLSFLNTIALLLTNGGRLYATVPAYNFLWSHEDEDAGHFRRYNRKTISGVLGQAGFDIEYFSYFFRFLPPAIFLLRTLPSVLGRKNKPSADKAKKDHSKGGKLSGWILESLLRSEIRQIKKRAQFRFGGSCFVVAKRRDLL